MRDYGREPSFDELSERINISAQQLKEFFDAYQNTSYLSLDRLVGQNEDTALMEFIASDGPSNFEAIAIPVIT